MVRRRGPPEPLSADDIAAITPKSPTFGASVTSPSRSPRTPRATRSSAPSRRVRQSRRAWRPAKGDHLHGIPPHPGISRPDSVSERLRDRSCSSTAPITTRNRERYMQHGLSANTALITSPVRRPPTNAPRWWIISVTKASIMIATEAAAEGINLQFCSWWSTTTCPGIRSESSSASAVVTATARNTTWWWSTSSTATMPPTCACSAAGREIPALQRRVRRKRRSARRHRVRRRFREAHRGHLPECRTTEEIENEFEQLRGNGSADHRDNGQHAAEAPGKLRRRGPRPLKINLDQSREYISRYERRLWAVTRHEGARQARDVRR